MLEKPEILDDRVIACLQKAFGLVVAHLSFLPLGNDRRTAVYRAVDAEGRAYFVKLRSGFFDELSVALPKAFSDLGIRQIIPPLTTDNGLLWAELDEYKTMLYPFIEGNDGYEVTLSDRQWVEFGAALRAIHTAAILPELTERLQIDRFSNQARETVKVFLRNFDAYHFDEPAAARIAGFLKARQKEVEDLVGRADQLARMVAEQPPEYAVCHSDIHAGNLLLDESGSFYIVDWDDLVLAPKERDLMYIGGGWMGRWRSPRAENALFYRGYGNSRVDPVALAYYRYERIVQDIAAYCEQILSKNDNSRDLQQSFGHLRSTFQPGHVLEIAYRSDGMAGSE